MADSGPDREVQSIADTVGDLVALALAELGVRIAFGVASIHNLPILDAIARQGRVRFIPARGEAGALNMADAYARLSRSLGVAITSTGSAAANAAGAQVEALSAGTPVLHITSQIDRAYLDRDRAAIHDVPRQGDMLRAISKAHFRVWEGRSAVATIEAAARTALTPPRGPVSIEIPIDVQRETHQRPAHIALGPITRPNADPVLLDALAELVCRARRPMLWLGGGAREAGEFALDLAERGFAVVTSTNGRTIVPEDHRHSLGAYNMTKEAQSIYDSADLLIVVGSRLRGNETRNNTMRLPRPLAQIDADPMQAARNYSTDLFINSDAAIALAGLCKRIPARLEVDPHFLAKISSARASSEQALRSVLGPYRMVADLLSERLCGGRHPFVRDVTIANSTFGNRYVRLAAPHLGVHALGGGIGQGISMAIGAALAGVGAKTIALIGDGGLMVNLGELSTAVEANADIAFILMNDRGYGVIRNIQDAQYGGRRSYVDLHVPDLGLLSAAFGLPHERISRVEDFACAFDRALSRHGPQLIEIDMIAIGAFAEAFVGPPAGAAGADRRAGADC